MNNNHVELVIFLIEAIEKMEQNNKKSLLKLELKQFLKNIIKYDNYKKYKDDYITPLDKIIELIQNSNIDDALRKFKNYLIKVQELGSYTPEKWTVEWSKEVNFFSENLVSYLKNSSGTNGIDTFIKHLNKIISKSDNSKKEILFYLQMEIAFFNQKDITDYSKAPAEMKKYENQLKPLVQRYDKNLWFKRRLAETYLVLNKLNEALVIYKELTTDININDLFSYKRAIIETDYIRSLISESQGNRNIDDAQIYLKNLIGNRNTQDIYTKKHIDEFRKISERLQDEEVIRDDFTKKNDEIKKELKESSDKMNQNLEKKHSELNEQYKDMKSQLAAEKTKVIEILAFFSAIIAFLFSTVSVAKSFSFHESIWFLIALGAILISFVSILSFFINQPANNKFGYSSKNITPIGFTILIIIAIVVFVPKQTLLKSTTTIEAKNKDSIITTTTIKIDSLNIPSK